MRMAWPEWLRAPTHKTTTPPDIKQYNRLLETAAVVAKLNPSALHDLVKAVLRPLQSELIMGVLERGQDTVPDMSGYEFFFDLTKHPCRSQTAEPRLLDPAGFELHLGRDLILPCPWKPDRLERALALIDSRRDDDDPAIRERIDTGPWNQKKDNHQVRLWLPWRIGFVINGHHSIATGIITGKGSLVPEQVHDMSFLLDEFACDGRSYTDRSTGRPIAPVTDVRRAAVFEIGRLIRERTAGLAVNDASVSHLTPAERA